MVQEVGKCPPEKAEILDHLPVGQPNQRLDAGHRAGRCPLADIQCRAPLLLSPHRDAN